MTGYILSQFSEFHTGLRFAALKVVAVNQALAEEHYAEHKGKFFYPSLLQYIRGYLHYPDDPSKRRVIAILYRGPNAIKNIREICGNTNPHEARQQRPGCIRALGTVIPLYDEKGKFIGERSDNLIHASANPEDAEREIKLWFLPTDIPPILRSFPTEISKEYFYYKNNAISSTYTHGKFLLHRARRYSLEIRYESSAAVEKRQKAGLFDQRRNCQILNQQGELRIFKSFLLSLSIF